MFARRLSDLSSNGNEDVEKEWSLLFDSYKKQCIEAAAMGLCYKRFEKC
jgi:hypothetical protein